MKAIFEFALPEEREEYEEMAKSGARASFLHEFENLIRHKLKYEELSETEYKVWEDVRNKYYDLYIDIVGLE